MKKILLIEDNREVRENTSEILELAGYEVQQAENGKAGVKSAILDQPDLIICDIMMPEMDGYDVLQILQRNPKTSAIPFIFLTAKADKTDFRKGMTLGADDYVTKPFDDIELLQAIDVRLSKAQKLDDAFSRTPNGLDSFMNEALGKTKMDNLSEDREIQTFPKKATLYREGEVPRKVFYIRKGRVKISRTNDDGRQLIVALIGEGEFFGYLALLQGKAYPETAIALEETEVSIIPKADFFHLIHDNRDVASRFIKILASDLLDVEEQLIDLAYNSVRKRVADALIRLKHRYDRDPAKDQFTIAILREDLASMVGTAKETVIRTLSDFKDEGLIDVKGSKITLLDEDRLRNMWN